MRYFSNCKRLTVFLKVNGRSKRVCFEPKEAIPYGVLISYDEGVCNAIEAHSQYGKMFFADPAEKAKQSKLCNDVSRGVELKEYPDVTRTQDAIKILIEEYGVMSKDVRSRASVLERASSLGISFPNLQ